MLLAHVGVDASSVVASPANRYCYNGMEEQNWGNLGYYDYNARFYNPAIGRFSSIDPLAEKRISFSPYNYVQNNPINRIDPTGMLDDWIENSETGEIEWRAGVTSSQNTPSGYNYIGKEYNGITVVSYHVVNYENPKSLGLKIELGYNKGNTDDSYQWLQTVDTNYPKSDSSLPSQYVDPMYKKGETDEMPFYYGTGERNSFRNKNGYNVWFYDKPYRSGGDDTYWNAELSLAIKSGDSKTYSKTDQYLPIMTLRYGFKATNQRTELLPLKVSTTRSSFHQSFLDNPFIYPKQQRIIK